MLLFDFMILSSHPCLPGHFPDNSIVPGVVIIDKVIAGFTSDNANVNVKNIPNVKFLQPLEPDVLVQVRIEEKKLNLFTFDCFVKGTVIASGQLRTQQVET